MFTTKHNRKRRPAWRAIKNDTGFHPRRSWSGTSVAGLIFGCALLASPAVGQDGLRDMVFTVATTTRNQLGQHWAYLVWQGSDPNLLAGHLFAVYAKEGDAGSTQPYQPQKPLAELQTAPSVIAVLVDRAVNVGDDKVKLEQDINQLFGKTVPPTLDLPNKISLVIRSASADPEQYPNLLLLARLHPAISLCLGLAHVQPISAPPGVTTFEVRSFDREHQRDKAVLGRVTVQAGAPTVLPPPDPPVEVPEWTPKGHLNVKLRWGTPDPLRKLALLQFGYNVWRVTKARAESASPPWQVQPPTPAALLAVAAAFPADVTNRNRLPILPDKTFTAAEAAQVIPPGDTNTMFFADDDGRFFLPNYNPLITGFTNGAQFYYFVTARDILGRDGLVSGGTLVTVCDRLPPPPPPKVEVVNDYHYLPTLPTPTEEQRLKVVWVQNTNTADENIHSYYVYRWTNLNELHALGGVPEKNRIKEVVQTNGQYLNWYVDNELPKSPKMPDAAGQTYWYTVRTAETNYGCGTNLSPHSPPVFGVLRDRKGPAAPSGRLKMFCVKPQVVYASTNDVPAPNLPQPQYRYRLVCEASDARLAWAEFFYGANTTPLGRLSFTAVPGSVTLDYVLAQPEPNQVFHCRVALTDGRVSTLASTPDIGLPSEIQIRQVKFRATVEIYTYTDAGDPCTEHEPRPFGPTFGVLQPLCVELNLPLSAREWKLYRRVDDGPLTLWRQGTNAPTETLVYPCDDAMPINGATICYFAQVSDENGNPSPLVRLSCAKVAGTLPVPVLHPIEAASLFQPSMKLRWFCPPYGVERFYIYVAPDKVPEIQPPELSKPVKIEQIGWWVGQTPRLGPRFGPGPEFEATVNIEKEGTYSVFIVPVGLDGIEGGVDRRSNTNKFAWLPLLKVSILQPNQVPWPALGLPAVTNWWQPNKIEARRLKAQSGSTFDGLGVRIAQLFITEATSRNGNNPPQLNRTNVNPAELVFRDRSTNSLLPVTLYRCQVTNSAYPTVSGDLVQVSPLMEEIAYAWDSGHNDVIIHDPFIDVMREQPLPSTLHGIYLLDTQPVIQEANYRYFLVRFDKDTHEITEVIPTNDVKVTP